MPGLGRECLGETCPCLRVESPFHELTGLKRCLVGKGNRGECARIRRERPGQGAARRIRVVVQPQRRQRDLDGSPFRNLDRRLEQAEWAELDQLSRDQLSSGPDLHGIGHRGERVQRDLSTRALTAHIKRSIPRRI